MTPNPEQKPVQKILPHLPALIIFLILVITGLQGLDFGFHWDEDQQFQLVRNSLESGILLPGWYKYPSISYWLSFLGALPHAILSWPQAGGDWQALVAHLLKVTETHAYLLQVRAIFLFTSALALVWVYLQPLAWGRSWVEGLLAAALVGLSWEVAYHARWIAPDTIMMQLGALALLAATLSIQQPGRRFWLYGSAVAAGLACGAKYPGGLLIVPVLIAGYYSQQVQNPVLRFIRAAIPILLVFGAAYLVSTPGTILEPIHFYKSVSYEIRHYSAGFSEQVIPPGLPHLGRMLNYLAQALFSHFRPIAWFFALLIMVGAYALARESVSRESAANTSSRPIFLLLTIFPVLYLLYFSTQSVMRARNLLVVAPFLALLAAHGAHFIWQKLPDLRLRWAWPIALASLLSINAAWLIYTADSIQNRSPQRFAQELANYIGGHPGEDFWVSQRVWQQLGRLPGNLPTNVALLPATGNGWVAFYAYEGMENPNDWPSNRPGLATRIFGPWEVNFDYYPRWAGEDRILLMPLEKARQIGIRVVR